MVGALGTQWAGWWGHVGLGPHHNPPSQFLVSLYPHRSSLFLSLSLFLLFSLSVLLPLRLPHDPSPRRVAGRPGRPAEHQKSRLSEFQPEPANAWLSLSHGALARTVHSPRTSVTIPEDYLVAVCGPGPFFLPGGILCGPITRTTRVIYDCHSGNSF